MLYLNNYWIYIASATIARKLFKQIIKQAYKNVEIMSCLQWVLNRLRCTEGNWPIRLVKNNHDTLVIPHTFKFVYPDNFIAISM